MAAAPKVLISTSTDPAENLAAELALLRAVGPGEERLLLYVDGPAVVIGRFQNPWRECRTGLARRCGVPVFRRDSGGGTVVHGPGNLNWAVIAGRGRVDAEGNLDRVIRALAGLGAGLRRTERRDLVAVAGGGERKVSGSAYRQTAGRSLHHATLLVDADLTAMGRLLDAPPRPFEARGTPSRPSPVANLGALVPGLGMAEAIAALAAAWGAPSGGVPFHPASPASPWHDALYARDAARFADPAWTFGRTPAFRFAFPYPGPGGRAVLDVRDGTVAAVEGPPEAARLLEGRPFGGPSFLAAGGERPPGWLAALAAAADGDAGGISEDDLS